MFHEYQCDWILESEMYSSRWSQSFQSMIRILILENAMDVTIGLNKQKK